MPVYVSDLYRNLYCWFPTCYALSTFSGGSCPPDHFLVPYAQLSQQTRALDRTTVRGAIVGLCEIVQAEGS